MQLHTNTQIYQSQLAKYCRTGEWLHIPGVHTTHVQQYRRLVYNVIDEMLQHAYPVMHSLILENEWNNCVQQFFSTHNCISPQIWFMPQEFLAFVCNKVPAMLTKYPHLPNLMLYEWAEVELFMMEDIDVPYTTTGDVLFSKLIINPEHRLLAFNYPIHQKNVSKILPADKGNYYLIGHRNKEGNVGFTDLSPVLVRMIEYLEEKPLSIIELIQQLENEYNINLSEIDKQNLIQFFHNALKQQIIIGFAVGHSKNVLI
ncbi:DNA-binding domain-containing protein [Hydrotalea sp.]|uniref:HvfC/BufC N-terminal domain-containing protein n=1 Tax=Hydrotalea sp. TaxID=2881279 RepID=UPI003D0988E2